MLTRDSFIDDLLLSPILYIHTDRAVYVKIVKRGKLFLSFRFSFVSLRRFSNIRMNIKEKIATQAGELFLRNGIKSVSMDEIAIKLGMSKRTIYEYFTDKEEIVVYFLKYIENCQLEQFDYLFKTEPTVIDAFVKLIKGYRELDFFYNVKFKEDIERFFPKAKQVWEEKNEKKIQITKNLLQEGIKQGVVRPELNLDVTAFLLQETSGAYLHASRKPTLPFTIWELFYTMLINFVRGVATEKGIKIVDEFILSEQLNNTK